VPIDVVAAVEELAVGGGDEGGGSGGLLKDMVESEFDGSGCYFPQLSSFVNFLLCAARYGSEANSSKFRSGFFKKVRFRTLMYQFRLILVQFNSVQLTVFFPSLLLAVLPEV